MYVCACCIHVGKRRMLGMMVRVWVFLQDFGLVLRNHKKGFPIREYASRGVACVCLVAFEKFPVNVFRFVWEFCRIS